MVMSHLREIWRKVQREGETIDEATGRHSHEADSEPSSTTLRSPPTAEPSRLPEDFGSRLDKLQDATNTASGHVRNVYLTFLLFGLYLAIIVGSTTHGQLLRASPVTLPLLEVGLPLVGFYWVAPALFVLLHLNLLLQLYLLSGKLHRLDRVIGEAISRKHLDHEGDEDLRAQLYPSPFSQMLIGRQHGRLMRLMICLMVLLTVLILPVALLLAAQVRFLPYHDAWTTMWHRFLIATDLLLILTFWHPIRGSKGHRFIYLATALPGIFTTLALSFLIFTFPGDRHSDFGDPMDELLLKIVPDSLIDSEVPRASSEEGQQMLWLTRYLFDRLPILERNLVVRETNLVSNWPTQAQIDQYGEDLAWQNFGMAPSLRGRDLRYADLSLSIFVRGDFIDANLQRAELREVNLQDADLVGVNFQEAFIRDANLRGATARGANLVGASLRGSNLQDADLSYANLQGAEVNEANLQSASLWNAYLQGANLGDADLRGADLSEASLQGAALGRADLRGANFRDAELQGAYLVAAKLDGALFSCGPFGGCANLQGANLWHASLQGADLRGARIWRALFDGKAADFHLADLRDLDLNSPGKDQLDEWLRDSENIKDKKARATVQEILNYFNRQVARRQEAESWRPALPIDLAQHEDLLLDPRSESFAEFDTKLSEFLVKLACDPKAPPGVAQTVADRAVYEHEGARLYPGFVAQALLGNACPPAQELHHLLVEGLRERLVATTPSKAAR